MAHVAAHAAIIAQVVVMARRSFFGERFQYLTSYKGLILYTKTNGPLALSGRAEIIAARSIWVPQ